MDEEIQKILEYCNNDPRTKEVIDDVKIVIDEIRDNFTRLEDRIKKLARILYEDRICGKDKISQVLKKILIDKIKEGKISQRWIEICLPNEYKRKYNRKVIDKTEQNSLSNNNQSNNKRDRIIFPDSKESHKENIIEQQALEDEPKLPIKNVNKIQEIGCNLCKNTIAENIELKEALQKTRKFLSAQNLKHENEIDIPDEKFNVIISEINKNDKFLNIKFDIQGNILSIKSKSSITEK
jgi:copper chaperone CopZ